PLGLASPVRQHAIVMRELGDDIPKGHDCREGKDWVRLAERFRTDELVSTQERPENPREQALPQSFDDSPQLGFRLCRPEVLFFLQVCLDCTQAIYERIPGR